MSNRILWWVIIPLLAVGLVFGANWLRAPSNGRAANGKVQVQTQQVVASAKEKREYVLEVIGLGATLDKYRQGALWDVLQKGNAYGTVRELDKEKYPWSDIDKSGISGSRGGDSLENGVPVFNAEPPSHNELEKDRPDNPRSGLASGFIQSGMAWHLFVVGPRRFEEHPDRILEEVFAFFDTYPDVPYVVLNSDDSMTSRDMYRAEGAPALQKDGYYIPEMPDSSALLVLARRERVDPVRPFVWDDPDNKYLQEKFRMMYADLMHTVPFPGYPATRTPAQVGADTSGRETLDSHERQPLVSEWLEGSAAFAQRPDVRGTGPISLMNIVDIWANRPPKEWKPTPWFPIPWNREQLATFDKLPTLGFIHRPTFVKFTDEHGKPITRRDERDKVMQAGWQAALLNLPETERVKAPALVIAATGDDTSQLTMRKFAS